MCECYIYYAYVYRKYLLLLLYCSIKRIWGIQLGFKYPCLWFGGWIFTQIGVRFGFGFYVWVSVLDAQTLHLTQTRPVAILSGESNPTQIRLRGRDITTREMAFNPVGNGD